ncbi:GNAT family N-acetyltransferase [soil metagenome]
MLTLRTATDADFAAIWPIFREVVAAGDTYTYAPDTTYDEAKTIWLDTPRATYVGVLNDEVVGTYYLKANQPGLGAHVCNAGYMVSAAARGRGVGRALCLHSQQEAVALGFKAMQFNLVVGTNPAVKLWQALGFETVGTLPGAFNHPTLGFTDALVMYKWLEWGGPSQSTAC